MRAIGARALATWLLLLVIASLNGWFRETVLISALHETGGHVVSSLLLSVAIAGCTYLAIRWIAPRRPLDAARVGTLWLLLTLAFEFGFGGAQGLSWPEMLRDYDVASGRIWILVLLVIAAAPAWAASARRVYSEAPVP
jgi:hypothetical protein